MATSALGSSSYLHLPWTDINVGSVEHRNLRVIYSSKLNEICLYLLPKKARSKLESGLRIDPYSGIILQKVQIL